MCTNVNAGRGHGILRPPSHLFRDDNSFPSNRRPATACESIVEARARSGMLLALYLGARRGIGRGDNGVAEQRTLNYRSVQTEVM